MVWVGKAGEGETSPEAVGAFCVGEVGGGTLWVVVEEEEDVRQVVEEGDKVKVGRVEAVAAPERLAMLPLGVRDTVVVEVREGVRVGERVRRGEAE